MMNGIISIKLGDKNARCFIDSGSLAHEYCVSHYHRHSYAEIHLVIDGEISYFIDKEVIKATAGSVIFIPSGVYHYTGESKGNLSYGAFQIDSDCKKTGHEKLSVEFLKEYFNEVQASGEHGNFAVLSATISYICSKVVEDINESAVEDCDYAYAINNFFGRYYNHEVTINELAKYLGLSEKQTTRLVRKYTGKTFGQNILEARMHTADYLCTNTDMPMAEIAQYVGYNSYGGFFKAREKFLAEKE